MWDQRLKTATGEEGGALVFSPVDSQPGSSVLFPLFAVPCPLCKTLHERGIREVTTVLNASALLGIIRGTWPVAADFFRETTGREVRRRLERGDWKGSSRAKGQSKMLFRYTDSSTRASFSIG